MIEELGKQIETLLQGAVDYGKTTIELTKLRAVDKVSDVAASILSKILIGAILFLLTLFFSLGLAIWLGEVIGKLYLGFFAVAGGYAFLAIVIHLFVIKWIKKIICNFIIENFLY